MEELLRSISSEELVEWAAYYRIDPFGSHRADIHAGIVASTLANIHARKGHRFTPADFIPTFGEPEKSKTMAPNDIHNTLAMMFGRPRHGQ